jgi:3'(2'), 5'-bisphosphate nucleotidase
MIPNHNPEIQFALHAARQAALMVRQIQQELITPALTKDDRSPVTVADFAAQAVVGRLLGQAFPADSLVAEEDSTALRLAENEELLEQVIHFARQENSLADGEQVCAWIDHNRVDGGARFWSLDPIDGTKGFLRGEQYALALALVVDGEVQIGVLACPNLVDACRVDLGGPGSLVIALRGQGAWTTPLAADGADRFEPLQVSAIDDPAQARILRSVESGHTNIDQVSQFAAELNVAVPPLSMDSQAKYAVLAAGQGEFYLRLLSADKPNYREKIWDQAAGSLIIEEAGGLVTDLTGKALDFTTGRSLKNNRGILASNRHLHPAALAVLRRLGA